MTAVSVILPTFNRADKLQRSIGSVLGQTHVDFELIVVDDGSTDHTHEVLSDFQDDVRLKVITLASNAGSGAARNAALQCAKHALVAFQDSDDEWHSNKLAEQIRTFSNDSEAAAERELGVVYSHMYRQSAVAERYLFQVPNINSSQLIDANRKAYSVEGISIVSCLIKRQLIEAIGGFNESLPALEDLELLARLAKICRFSLINKPLYTYHEGEGLMSNAAKNAAARRMLLQLFAPDLVHQKWFVAYELAHCHSLERQHLAQDGNRRR